jgi:type 1 glutamine amidotransferase
MMSILTAAVALTLLLPAAAEPAPIKTLIVTGYNHPAHNWKETTAALQEIYKADSRFDVRVVEDPAFLESPALAGYDVVVLNFADHERPSPGDKARTNLQQVIEGGKGLVVLHFASGAWDESPDYVKLAGRIWKNSVSGHDAKGPFHVEVLKTENPIVKGLESFDTDDELYYSLEGDQPIEVLATAKSKITGKDEPMAFIFSLGKGRVFHLTLGHDVKSLQVPGESELVRRGTAWAAGQPAIAPPPQPAQAQQPPSAAPAAKG